MGLSCVGDTVVDAAIMGVDGTPAAAGAEDGVAGAGVAGADGEGVAAGVVG